MEIWRQFHGFLTEPPPRFSAGSCRVKGRGKEGGKRYQGPHPFPRHLLCSSLPGSKRRCRCNYQLHRGVGWVIATGPPAAAMIEDASGTSVRGASQISGNWHLKETRRTKKHDSSKHSLWWWWWWLFLNTAKHGCKCLYIRGSCIFL